MLLELIPDQSNVFRFPVERRARATLELFYELLPDVREVMNVADAFELSVPDIEYRDMIDAETAEHILNNIVHEHGVRRRQALDDLLRPLLKAAIDASRHANDRRQIATEVDLRRIDAAARGEWTDDLARHAEAHQARAAGALIAAHIKAEEAHGAARAVTMAKRGEIWLPRDAIPNLSWLDEACSA